MDIATMLIRSEADRFAHVLSRTHPDQPVPTCPGWTAADLLWHLTEVHEFWAGILSSRALTDEDARRVDENAEPRPTSVEDVLRRRDTATAALLAQLEERADDEPAWSWFPPQQTVGFTHRMQMHEATIHRVDAQLTAGLPVLTPLVHTARDGIAHVIDVMWEAAHHWVPSGTSIETVGVLDIDHGHGSPHRVELVRCHGVRESDGEEYHRILARRLRGGADRSSLPTATVRGSAPALYLWVWGREAAHKHLDTGPERVTFDGDAVVVAATENLIAQGID